MAQKGFTLVELMVSLVISLLVGLAALSSAQFFMSMQRQSTGVGSALANTATAFASIKFESAQAGLGFFNANKLACTTFNVSGGATAVYSNSTLLPVSLSVTNDLPTLSLFYSSELTGAASATLIPDSTSGNATSTQIATYLPVTAGQEVLLVSSVSGVPCTLKTVTGVTASTGSGQTLAFSTSGNRNQYAFDTVNYLQGDAVLLTGSLVSTSFTVNKLNAGDETYRLVMQHPFDGTSVVLAKNVVAIAMQYGVTDANMSTISAWRYAKSYPLLTVPEDWSSLSGTQLQRVKAIKVAVLVRSEQKDKKTAGACTTTTVMPTLQGMTLGSVPLASTGLASTDKVAPALTGDWQCYRYAETSVVVPLRNLVLGM